MLLESEKRRIIILEGKIKELEINKERHINLITSIIKTQGNLIKQFDKLLDKLLK